MGAPGAWCCNRTSMRGSTPIVANQPLYVGKHASSIQVFQSKSKCHHYPAVAVECYSNPASPTDYASPSALGVAQSDGA